MNQKEFVNKYKFKFKKKLGQNFIVDDNVLNNIVNAAGIDRDTLIIEVGCGAGALTRKLAPLSEKVIGYEIDESLKPILSTIDNTDIIYDDFLKRNISEDLKQYDYKKLYLIANLPYYITTPIISKFIDEHVDIDKMIIMVQKEVGERFTAKPNTKDYNSLTIFINYYFNTSRLFLVSKNVFIPKPNVDSIVMKLEKKSNIIKPKDEKLFFKIVRESFKQKRKTLRNNLINYDFNSILKVLNKNGYDENVRAEALPLEIFIEISNILS